MGFSSGSGGSGSQVHPFSSFNLFSQFATQLGGGKFRANLPNQAEPFGSISSTTNPFQELLKTIEGQFASRPQNEFLGRITEPFGEADANLAGLQEKAAGIGGRLRSSALGRTDQAQIAAVEASRRSGGLVGDAGRVAASNAAGAAATQQAALAGAEIGGIQAEAGIAGQRANLAAARSGAEQFGARVEESRFAQELGTRVGARENFLNLLGSLAGAGTQVGGATVGGGSSNIGGSLK